MNLPEISGGAPRRSARFAGRVLSSLVLTSLVALVAAFFIVLTLAWSAGHARASQPSARADGGGRPTSTATPACALDRNYQVTASAGATMIPATNYVPGTSCSGCVVRIDLPFGYQWYDLFTRSYANLSSEGNLQFLTESAAGNNLCLPQGSLMGAIMPYWDDLTTSLSPRMGYYTALVGAAPNRIFVVRYYGAKITAGRARTVEYEVLLYEGEPRFDIIYGAAGDGGREATIGVQGISGGDGRWTAYACNAQSIAAGTRLRFDRRICSLDR